ncbi:ParB/RepB/Spo0J family partition protein [Sediminitomix flava]|uniref:ParB family chromosome partitioning protein n=1 Tax=Sediminitomix flava TaxID=379075 RepID=A0A315Z922_SEDFL|nr:ParB/RepB/Spo0J family partition protein [Sediminitomix flava]PWJ40026.1 ParB family chromosome partitioning protein [Sediminitomix flava]
MAKKTLKKRSSLGKGLGAILGDGPENSSSGQENVQKETVVEKMDEIPVSAIEPNPYQPRTHFEEEALRELADSIRVQGVIQPITVRKLSEGSYQLISGERRWQASKLSGLETIPAYVRSADDQQMLEMALIENIQRENLNPIEIAISYQRLISECDLKQDELGGRVGKKRSTVTNYLRLLKLPPEIQKGVEYSKISMGHAKALINIENIELQLAIYQKILDENLSVRKVENLVRDIIQGKEPLSNKKPAPKPLSQEFNKLQSDLSSHFGTRVNVKSSGEDKGEIRIPFTSIHDLNRILDILKNNDDL